jgi:hypothetical protein
MPSTFAAILNFAAAVLAPLVLKPLRARMSGLAIATSPARRLGRT